MNVSFFDSITPLLASALAAAIPLLLAALGEIIAERAGVLNLGLEGMMLVGALASFVAVTHGAPLWVAVLVGMGASALFSLPFAFVTLTLQANQVAAGLSLTILGAGLSAVLGRSYVGFGAAVSFAPMPIPYLSTLPVLGASLFSLNLLGYLCIVLLGVTIWFLQRTRGGLALKAVGESPIIARSLGLPVTLIRYAAVVAGGAMSGLAGSYYSIAQFKLWQDNLTSGNGWIALALVVFATWRPWRAAIGALLFGSVTALGLYFQAIGIKVSTFALASLPYVATIVVLVILSSNQENIRRHAPAWLGKPFHDAS
jgi:general nucleoside transport system permease protein